MKKSGHEARFFPNRRCGYLPVEDGDLLVLAPALPELDGLLVELELDGVEELPLAPELDGLEELMPLEELDPPEALCPACHSERLSLPSWSLSSLSNWSLLELDDEPPAAELGLEDDEDELPPADDDEAGADDLLLCDVEGDDAPELLEFFDASLA